MPLRRQGNSITWFLLARFLFFGLLFSMDSMVTAGGTLFIIGGSLRSNNAAVFDRLLAAGGGPKSCRFAIFRAASSSIDDAKRFSSVLQRYHVPAEQIAIIDIHPANSKSTAFDPANVELMAQCNVFYFTGGSQRRITQSLLDDDGSDTPVLAAIRKSLDRGGVVAGTSAGAAMQSEVMLAVSGLPDDAMDEGMDALDFGISDNPKRRGLFVSHGLSFFREGIIDQHFGQFRGRLGRLSRTLIERKIRYGFGVDENTAVIVSSDGSLEVRGTGSLTIVDAKDATMNDGPLGCRMDGLRISCLEDRDRFEPATGHLTVSSQKKLVDASWSLNRGNYLITDIASRGAMRFALFQGLAENTSRKQVGIWLRYSESYSHGYRFTFRETDETRSWAGPEDDTYAFAIENVALTVEPILSSLNSPESSVPIDMPSGGSGIVCQAIWYRGILAADTEHRLRPGVPVTRAELAMAISQAIHLLPPANDVPAISDIADETPLYDAVTRVLNTKLMDADENGKFHPNESISRQDAGRILLELHTHNVGQDTEMMPINPTDTAEITPALLKSVTGAVRAGLLTLTNGKFRPQDPLTRQETAEAIYRVLDFKWRR